jgi:heme exporter protein C
MTSKPKMLKVLDIITIVSFLLAVIMVFFYAPLEKVMGAVQKVFYFHVAAGWVGMVSFGVAAFAGILYLIKKDPKWDLIGFSSVEIGIAFTMINVITGAIWARPIWNAWWTWDPRLTTATIMELIYFAYLMLRQGIDDSERRGRFGAVYAIIGFISVPLTFFSIRIFDRTIHPVVIGNSGSSAVGSFDMSPLMLQTLLFSILAFTILFFDLMWHRIRLGQFANKIEELKLKIHD